MLSIIFCAYWPFVYFLWRNVSSSPLPIFNQVVCFWPWHRCLPDCLERSLLLKAIGHLPRVLWGSLFPASWGYWALTQGSLGQPLPCFSRLLGTYPGFSGQPLPFTCMSCRHKCRDLPLWKIPPDTERFALPAYCKGSSVVSAAEISQLLLLDSVWYCHLTFY